ncbi:MAG: hypothetical protein O3A46_15220, partial [Candidatus Poribacteria bacterium]|nr:hypothetical protein [Candidatus Poribacteria bacterium]
MRFLTSDTPLLMPSRTTAPWSASAFTPSFAAIAPPMTSSFGSMSPAVTRRCTVGMDKAPFPFDSKAY